MTRRRAATPAWHDFAHEPGDPLHRPAERSSASSRTSSRSPKAGCAAAAARRSSTRSKACSTSSAKRRRAGTTPASPAAEPASASRARSIAPTPLPPTRPRVDAAAGADRRPWRAERRRRPASSAPTRRRRRARRRPTASPTRSTRILFGPRSAPRARRSRRRRSARATGSSSRDARFDSDLFAESRRRRRAGAAAAVDRSPRDLPLRERRRQPELRPPRRPARALAQRADARRARSCWRCCGAALLVLQVAHQFRDSHRRASGRDCGPCSRRWCGWPTARIEPPRRHRRRQRREQRRCTRAVGFDALRPVGRAAQPRRRPAAAAGGRPEPHRRQRPAGRAPRALAPRDFRAAPPARRRRRAAAAARSRRRRAARRRLHGRDLLSLNPPRAPPETMPMAALICGSLAFDTITTFPGRFAEQILPRPAAHPERVVPGADAAPRVRRLRRQHRLQPGRARRRAGGDGRGRQRRRRLPGSGCARGASRPSTCASTTTATRRRRSSSPTATTTRSPPSIPARCSRRTRRRCRRGGDLRIAIIAPDGRDAMLRHAEQLAAAGMPFIFDPGQGLPMFDGAELRAFVDRASWVAVNDYEAEMLCERTGLTLEAMSRSQLRGVVVTLGAEGCDVWQDGARPRVAGRAPPRAVVDPTGCGDAFRAALLYGLERGWPLVRCAELGNRLGALKIAQPRRPESCAGSHASRRADSGLPQVGRPVFRSRRHGPCPVDRRRLSSIGSSAERARPIAACRWWYGRKLAGRRTPAAARATRAASSRRSRRSRPSARSRRSRRSSPFFRLASADAQSSRQRMRELEEAMRRRRAPRASRFRR